MGTALGCWPSVVAHDRHPDYVSTRYAGRISGVELVLVQHHHAHIAACMIENGLEETVIGLAFDGMGLGSDNTAWGGEFLLSDLSGFTRATHLKQYRLPGGDQATLNPERIAFSCLLAELDGDVERALRLLPGLDAAEAGTMERMLERGLGCPATSSAGRLFDAVSALLGFRGRAAFSGQAAMELQALAARGVGEEYDFAVTNDVVDLGPMILGIVSDIERGVERGRISAMFHNTLAAAAVRVCGGLVESHGRLPVVLSGGVFMNRLLRELITERLQTGGTRVYTHSVLSPGDECVSLGQAAIAMARERVA
jgi:hydrogenase maturation protein HypF